ncbi:MULTISPECIES: site-specific integrase [Ralstonia]|nr:MULTISPECIES: site-specific integrase [Ralstonia]ANH75955.1 phage integrase family protein [Ralstonia insidiosa]
MPVQPDDRQQWTVKDADDWLDQIVRQLPDLPPLLRYYDDFDDTTRVIEAPASATVFPIHANGRIEYLDFSAYGSGYGMLLRHLFAHLLTESLHVSTVADYIGGARYFSHAEVMGLLVVGPEGSIPRWMALRALDRPVRAYGFAKGLLRMLCHYRLCGWAPGYLEFVSVALPWPANDKYAGVRTGEVFLSVEEEAVIIRYLDETSQTVQAGSEIDLADLCDAVMLLSAYQFGMRPIQIAMLTLRDVRVWQDASDVSPSVHLTFRMAKQRRSRVIKPLPRRVKREWAALPAQLEQAHRAQQHTGAQRFCCVGSASDASTRIAELTERLLGARATATDLRHTAAQRLVDAGANQEELAAFLGHADLATGLVYFDGSPNQAERVNRAMGLSPVYQRVARIAHARFVSSEELSSLKGEQQIAGVPHGLPIAGIGGCTSGQPACPFNPITSCYGCHRFMPVRDASLHREVLAGLRGVVRLFHDASRGEASSPAYLQLQHAIAGVQAILAELEGEAK